MNARTKSIGKKVLAIAGCLVALALVQVASPATAHAAGPGSATRLLVVLGLLGGAAFLAWKKLNGQPAGLRVEPALQVVERTTLGPRHGLALIEADGIRVLVAFGEGFAQVLPLDAAAVRPGSAS